MKLCSSLFVVLFCAAPAVAQSGFVSTTEPFYDGRRVTVDLPLEQRHKNVGGSDGAGLCVYTSAWHSAIWQSVSDIYGFREWMRHRPGGSYPQKFDATMKQYCQQMGVPIPLYLQHEGGSVDVLELALKTGRAPAVTYCGVDTFYGNQVIGHMVSLVFLDDVYACILDNNDITHFRWMPRNEFIARWTGVKTNGQPYMAGRSRIGGGWTIVLLDSPPTPYAGKPQVQSLEPTQCPNGRCPVPSAGPQPIGSPPTANHRWGQFRDGAWGWLLVPNIAPQAAVADFPPDGVAFDKLSSEHTFSISGNKCLKSECMQALVGGSPGLIDDSKKWNLSVVGDDKFRSLVKDHLSKISPDTLAKLHVKFYAPTDWQVKQFNLPSGVALRSPAVNRVSTQLGAIAVGDYTLDLLIELIKLIDGLSKPTPPTPPPPSPAPQPNPAPNSPPNTDPPSDPTPAPTPSNPLAVVLAILAALYLLFRKKQQ